MNELPKSHRIALKAALTGWLFGWFVKIAFILPDVLLPAIAWPLAHQLFPAIMQRGETAAVIVGAGLLVAPVLLSARRRMWQAASTAMTLLPLMALGHQSLYNDATYVTCFWTGLWCMWLAWSDEEPKLAKQAKTLALTTVSLMFLGGFVGKLTSGYWSGEVFHGYYIQKRDYFVWEWVRSSFGAATQLAVARWFSRAVVIGEGLMALVFVVPFRYAAPFAMVAMVGVVAASHPYLLSVFAPLLGMTFGAWRAWPHNQ